MASHAAKAYMTRAYMVRRVWLQLQLLSLVLFAEYCWLYSFLSFELYTAEMLVFLCLRISASSIWNFCRFGVFYWYFVQFSAWSSVNRITRRHSCHQQLTLSCNIGQGNPWRHLPPTTVSAWLSFWGTPSTQRGCSQYS